MFEGNSRVNNYFDGPFDQLPDNFIEGETLREAILAVEPTLTGKIDRYGISPGGPDRYMIGPYRHYRTDDDLMVFHSCATDKRCRRRATTTASCTTRTPTWCRPRCAPTIRASSGGRAVL